MNEPLIFSTASYAYLASDIAQTSGWELGTITRRTFPDGERYRRIDSDPADRDIVLIGGTVDDESTLELYDLACGLVTGGGHQRFLVIERDHVEDHAFQRGRVRARD